MPFPSAEHDRPVRLPGTESHFPDLFKRAEPLKTFEVSRVHVYDKQIARTSRQRANDVSDHVLHNILPGKRIKKIDYARFRRKVVLGGVQTDQLDVEAALGLVIDPGKISLGYFVQSRRKFDPYDSFKRILTCQENHEPLP